MSGENVVRIVKQVSRVVVSSPGPQGPAGSGGGGGGGSGDVSGPSSSVADTLARFSGTTGKVIKGSSVVVPDALSGTMGSAALQASSAFEVAGAAATATSTAAAALASHAGTTSSVHGITDFGATLTGAADAPAGRTALGLGTSAVLDVPASGDATAGQVVKGTDSRLTDARTPTAHTHDFASITSKPSTIAGYGITDAQSLDTTLTALAGLDSSAGLVEQIGADAFTKRAIGVGASTSVLTRADGDTRYDTSGAAALVNANLGTHASTTSGVHGITAFGASLVDDPDSATARATLQLVIGTNVQAYDAELAAWAGLASAADKLGYFTGSGTADLATFTSFARNILDDPDAATVRGTVGVTQACIRPLGAGFDGQGSVIPAGKKSVVVTALFSGTIVKWRLTGSVNGAAATGSAVVDIYKAAFSTSSLPVVGDSITASAKPTISSAKAAESSTLTGWSTTVTAGDQFIIVVDSCSTFTELVLVLEIDTTT